MLTCDEYLTPATLEAAFDAIEAHRGGYRLIAGATDTFPWAREGRADDVHVPALIDVSRIPELNERRIDENRARLGAATAIQRFLDDDALMRALPCAAACAVWFADDQIRVQATIGGNIVNASPAADATPCLIAHEAEVELASRTDGTIMRRRMPLDRFVCGPGKTALRPGEVLVAVECDALPGYGGSFEKVGHRRSLVISLVCLAVLAKVDNTGRNFAEVRLAIGGIGPVPRRLSDVEQFLNGGPISAERLDRAADMPVELVASRTRLEYRRDVVRGFVLRGLIEALRNAGADPATLVPDLEAAYA